MLAEWFPQADTPTSLLPVAPAAIHPAPAPGDALAQSDLAACTAAPAQSVANIDSALAPERVDPEASAPIQVVPAAPQRRVAPLSPGRFELRLTIPQSLHDKLKRAQELLGHSVPSGDFAQVLERALDELIAKQEKVQFAVTENPRKARRSSNPRYISAPVKREVRKRDRGQCTYVGDDGHRCGARKLLQYDHVIPVARGGTSNVANVRLRCRAHNQLEAEQVFGTGFMEEKRDRGPRASELQPTS
jgi:5-methylcytosine-specific restriction endonuclease McrA